MTTEERLRQWFEKQRERRESEAPVMSEYTFTRLCYECRIQWEATMATRDCPKCGATAFFTVNAGDIGTAIDFDAEGLSMDDFASWPERTADES